MAWVEVSRRMLAPLNGDRAPRLGDVPRDIDDAQRIFPMIELRIYRIAFAASLILFGLI
jgi:hypothetical protein